jgi:hypothetical protein
VSVALIKLSPSQEVHILHEYPSDFYGKELRVVMLGFVRPEYNYAGLGKYVRPRFPHAKPTPSLPLLPLPDQTP